MRKYSRVEACGQTVTVWPWAFRTPITFDTIYPVRFSWARDLEHFFFGDVFATLPANVEAGFLKSGNLDCISFLFPFKRAIILVDLVAVGWFQRLNRYRQANNKITIFSSIGGLTDETIDLLYKYENSSPLIPPATILRCRKYLFLPSILGTNIRLRPQFVLN